VKEGNRVRNDAPTIYLHINVISMDIYEQEIASARVLALGWAPLSATTPLFEGPILSRNMGRRFCRPHSLSPGPGVHQTKLSALLEHPEAICSQQTRQPLRHSHFSRGCLSFLQVHLPLTTESSTLFHTSTGLPLPSSLCRC